MWNVSPLFIKYLTMSESRQKRKTTKSEQILARQTELKNALQKDSKKSNLELLDVCNYYLNKVSTYIGFTFESEYT